MVLLSIKVVRTTAQVTTEHNTAKLQKYKYHNLNYFLITITRVYHVLKITFKIVFTLSTI